MMDNILEYNGTFNIRISPELHRRLAMYASLHEQTLNSAVESAILEFVSNEEKRA